YDTSLSTRPGPWRLLRYRGRLGSGPRIRPRTSWVQSVADCDLSLLLPPFRGVLQRTLEPKRREPTFLSREMLIARSAAATDPPARPAGVAVNFIRSDHTPVRLREHHGTVTYSGTGRATRDMIEDRLDQIRLRFEVLRRTLPQGSRRDLVRGRPRGVRVPRRGLRFGQVHSHPSHPARRGPDRRADPHRREIGGEDAQLEGAVSAPGDRDGVPGLPSAAEQDRLRQCRLRSAGDREVTGG